MRARRLVTTALLLVCLVAAVLACAGEWERHAETSAALVTAASSLVGLSWAAAGAALTRARPRNSVGWVLLIVGTTTQLGLARASAAHGTPGTAGLLLGAAGGFAVFALLGLLPALYPSGHLPTRRWRAPVAVVLAGGALLQAQWFLAQVDPARPWPFAPAPSPPPAVAWLAMAVYAAGSGAVWAMCVRRLVRARSPERQQLAWLLAAVVLLLLAQFAGDSPTALWLQAATLHLLPVAVAVGIVRYRLLGIDVVLRRGLVYGVLTTAIAAVHAAAAVVTGTRLAGGTVAGVVAAALVAVGLVPLRTRVQRLVDRALYGRRSDPVAAVSDVGRRVATAEQDGLLDAVLAGVRDAVRAAGARIEDPDGRVLACTGDGRSAPAALSVPLALGGEAVGVLHVSARRPGEGYSPQDERVVEAVGPHVAVVLRTLHLAAALAGQHDAAVRAREEERERIRRDLHDGLGPSLTGVGLGLQALGDAVGGSGTDRTAALVAVLREEVAATVLDVRRILDDLRPAALAEAGLAAALGRSTAVAHASIPLEVSVAALPELPRDVEDALYRVALEAVTNVLRHAGATRASVRIRSTGEQVVLEVADDGGGFAPGSAPGTGLTSMRRRADHLGGTLRIDPTRSGTRVTFTVPLAPSADPAAAGLAGSAPR